MRTGRWVPEVHGKDRLSVRKKNKNKKTKDDLSESACTCKFPLTVKCIKEKSQSDRWDWQMLFLLCLNSHNTGLKYWQQSILQPLSTVVCDINISINLLHSTGKRAKLPALNTSLSLSLLLSLIKLYPVYYLLSDYCSYWWKYCYLNTVCSSDVHMISRTMIHSG